MMRCLIIDDEPLAIELLEDFVSKVPFLQLEKSCSNAMEATETIKSKQIDLIFTDIEMPDFSGVEFIKSLEEKPLFIFTTAYSHYALEGFNLNAVDYLIKPIPFHRFIKAVNRAQDLFSLKNDSKRDMPITNSAKSGDHVLIPRITMSSKNTDFPFPWKRTQFPVRPAFAITINKSQGQILSGLGYGWSDQFSHMDNCMCVHPGLVIQII